MWTKARWCSWPACCWPRACWRRWSPAACGCPSLLLFLGVGMLAGSDGFGWLDFNDYELARASASSRSR